MHKKLNKIMPWAVLLSELGHVFCCILPTIFSLLTLLAGIGLISLVPVFITDAHETLHDYELTVIAISGLVTILAWVVHIKANHIDCHSTGCEHEPCDTRKSRASLTLKIGTALFIANVIIFTFLHYLPIFEHN